MGQQEVYDLLKRHRKKWLSTREVADKLKISSGSVTMSLKKLRKTKLVDYKLARTLTNRPDRRGYVYRVS